MTAESRGRFWPSREARFLVSASLLCTAAITILAQPLYWEDPHLIAPAITIDLAFGLPLLGYLFLARGSDTKIRTLAPLFLLGLGLARWWIPDAHQASYPGLSWFLAGSEVLLAGYLVARMRRLVAAYRTRERLGDGRADALRHALSTVLGSRVGGAVFTEGSVLFYAPRFFSQPVHRPGVEQFSGHRRNAYPAVLGALLLLLVVETASAHLLLGLWSGRAAWISTALGAYSGVWLLGDYHAARLNPTFATRHELVLRVGLRWHARVRWSELIGVHAREPGEPSLRMTMLGAPDLWLEVAEPVRVVGPFGITRSARYLGVGVDTPDQLRALLLERMSSATR